MTITDSCETPEARYRTQFGKTAHLVGDDGESLCHYAKPRKWLPQAKEDELPDCVRCTEANGVSLGEQLSITGATYRQLDYWMRIGLLHPNNPRGGTGYQRTWPDGELEVARLMVQFIQAGLTVHAAHHAARHGGQLLVDGYRVVAA